MTKRCLRLDYYDSADINYASFFLTGFLQNAEDLRYELVVSKKTAPLLHDAGVQGNDVGSRVLPFICLFKVTLPGEEFYFCIDALDSHAEYHRRLLEKVRFYFKVNHNQDAIRRDPGLTSFEDKIVPVPLFFPLRPPRLAPFSPRLFSSGPGGSTFRPIKKRVKSLRQLMALEEMTRLRDTPKDLDLFFVTRFYGERAHPAELDLRYQIMKEIKGYPDVRSVVGFATGKPLRGRYSELGLRPYPFREYLRCLSRARVGIYVRGVLDCLSFKLGQLLALGMPIVGQTLHNNAGALYGNDYFPDQFGFDDPREIVREAIRLSRDPAKREIWSRSNARTFDTKFTPKAITAEILAHVTDVSSA